MTITHMTHIDNLLWHVPELLSDYILDLGSGRGDVLVEIAKRGGKAMGVEINPVYIKESLERASKGGVTVDVLQVAGEALPFADAMFGFVNMAEVIEHVENPKHVMQEVFRVLKPGGRVYVSVPSRFSLFDPHYHLYGINWMPRLWAEKIISLLKKNKSEQSAGRQRLSDMHYFRYGRAKSFFRSLGFDVLDIRQERIARFQNPVGRSLAMCLYHLIHPFYFRAFHFLLIKPKFKTTEVLCSVRPLD